MFRKVHGITSSTDAGLLFVFKALQQAHSEKSLVETLWQAQRRFKIIADEVGRKACKIQSY
jgi:hypothetical protein